MYEVGGHDVETPKKVNLGELDALQTALARRNKKKQIYSQRANARIQTWLAKTDAENGLLQCKS